MEREIDILLLEHTGNAASSKVTMAQAQSPAATPPSGSSTNTEFAHQQQQQPQMFPLQHQLQQQRQGQGVVTPASPLVIARIKDLFANSLPKENVILLREIGKLLCEVSDKWMCQLMQSSPLDFSIPPRSPGLFLEYHQDDFCKSSINSLAYTTLISCYAISSRK
jgi:hypothetical protein